MHAAVKVGLGLLAFSTSGAAGQPSTTESPLRRPSPTRALSSADAAQLTQLVVGLLDEGAGWGARVRALNELVENIRHVACVPPLRFVAMDEDEHANLRVHAVRGMLRLGPPALMADVVSLLRSKELDVRFGAWLILVGQYPQGREFGWDPDPAKAPEDNAEAIRRWEQWWEANKQTFKINRARLEISG